MEMIDIYDQNRRSTGMQLPRKTKLQPGQFMLYVLALIEGKDGKFLITQRALDKKWAAGEWEIPGGGVAAGESSLDAVIREVHEETGLDISSADIRLIDSYCNEDAESGDNYFADIYQIRTDIDLSKVVVDPHEVIDVRLATIDEIRQLHEEIGFLHYKRLCNALSAIPADQSDPS